MANEGSDQLSCEPFAPEGVGVVDNEDDVFVAGPGGDVLGEGGAESVGSRRVLVRRHRRPRVGRHGEFRVRDGEAVVEPTQALDHRAQQGGL